MKEYHVKLNKKKQKIILDCFIQDLPASTVFGEGNATFQSKAHRHTVNRWYRYFREAIAASMKTPRMSGDIEIDQKFFGVSKQKRYDIIEGKHVLRKQQHNVQTLVFVKRKTETEMAQVYAHIIKRSDRRSILPLIMLVVDREGTRLFSDYHRSFAPLKTEGYEHFTINKRREGYSKKDGDLSINTTTLENFCSFAEARLLKFKGISRTTFPLHLAECVFRYNHKADLRDRLMKLLK